MREAQPAAPRPPELPASGVVADDWDLLFEAVRARLTQCVREMTSAPPDAAGLSSGVQGSVLDCVDALQQLHSMLMEERTRQQRTELELQDAHDALHKTRIELEGTQAGERRARHLSLHDGLTTLPNRSYFLERLTQALAPPPPEVPALAVLYLDLDGFKPINDHHGHDTGDELLRIVAARLARAVRAEDMVCRMGGDEFACMLAGAMTRERLSHLACKLFDAISAPLKVGLLELTVRPSIGIAVCPSDGNSAAQLMRQADAAMYRAKRRQLGYAFFEPGAAD